MTLAAALIALLGCLAGLGMWAIWPRSPQGPIVCRIVSFSDWERAARLHGTGPAAASDYLIFQDVFEAIEAGRLPRSAMHNPLLAGDAFARVEVRNLSDGPIQTQGNDLGPGGPNVAWLGPLGTVVTTVWDETGNPVDFHPAHEQHSKGGLHEIELAQSLAAPIKTGELLPGDVVRHSLAPLGAVSSDAHIRPGHYTVRAVFRYIEASTGANKEVSSEPITIQVNQADIDQWRQWLARGQ
jgi:hypothetical protein